LPVQVNQVALCAPGVPFTHADFAPLTLMSRLMTFNFLHPEIREKGGAYGASASLDGQILSLSSFRDPATLATLQTFQRAARWAARACVPPLESP
jgi:Zn-dependent M16 (insulinase) family peptidase